MTFPQRKQAVIAIHGGAGAMAQHGTDPEQAAIMDGANLRAGAVACVSRIRRPVRAARAVLEHGEHVLLVAQGAERFAQAQGLELVAQDYFSTELRRAQLHKAIAMQTTLLDHDAEPGTALASITAARPLDEDRKLGTVGAVALDVHGNLAAATSTGGMTYKRAGRVGDARLIGSGTYADNRSAAVSCTGSGEMFIRVAVAHDVCARMAYGGASLEAAVQAVVMDELPRIGGRGGLIAVDAGGNLSLAFNTDGMYRGFARDGQDPQTAILR